ncbi:MAG: leucine-rich repeat domain-containing protein, partial [Candidatus Omnitrophica bacterium]|nr:leucine-rich repeat domain-containing protein [Candidatus Omnitrophota bacterium]
HLRQLWLDRNEIHDLTPLVGLGELEDLQVSGNPIEDFKPISSIVSLRILDVSSNQIRNIDFVEPLESLEELDLTGNMASDISPIASLNHLRRLYLSENQVCNLSSLRNLHDLEILNLRGNRVIGIAPLAGLTSLTSLNLYNNNIRDIQPLVENSGLGEGDWININENPLGCESAGDDIPELVSRGITVRFESECQPTPSPIPSPTPTETPPEGEGAIREIVDPSAWFEFTPRYADANSLVPNNPPWDQLRTTLWMHTTCTAPATGTLVLKGDFGLMNVLCIENASYEVELLHLDDHQLIIEVNADGSEVGNGLIPMCSVHLLAMDWGSTEMNVDKDVSILTTDQGEPAPIIGAKPAHYSPGIFAEFGSIPNLGLSPSIVHATPEQRVVTIAPFLASPGVFDPQIAHEATATIVYDISNMFLDRVAFDTAFWDLKAEYSEIDRGVIKLRCRRSKDKDSFHEKMVDLTFRLTRPGISRVAIQDLETFVSDYDGNHYESYYQPADGAIIACGLDYPPATPPTLHPTLTPTPTITNTPSPMPPTNTPTSTLSVGLDLLDFSKSWMRQVHFPQELLQLLIDIRNESKSTKTPSSNSNSP